MEDVAYSKRVHQVIFVTLAEAGSNSVFPEVRNG